MALQTINSMQAVFAKTTEGRAALSQRSGELTSRQRSILIMLDGNRSLEMLTVLIPSQELRETVPYLLQQGYIESIEPAQAQQAAPAQEVPPGPSAESARPRLTQDPGKVGEVRNFMLTTAQTYFRADDAAIVEAIERAADAAQLMAVAGHWHMALHASRHGSRFAAPYFAQVKSRLIEPQ